MSYQFNERIASNAPSTAKVALERGESQRTYPLTINTPSDIYTACKQILGYTNYAPSGSGGKMNRIPAFGRSDVRHVLCRFDTAHSRRRPTGSNKS